MYEKLSQNPKPFWSYIKALRKDKGEIPSLKTREGILTATDADKSNALVNQFSSVFTKENLDNLPELHKEFPDMPQITFSKEGIAKLLKNVKPDKASGPDKIPAKFLKEAADDLAKMYQHLFYQSYSTGSLPSTWTHALVCPIYKKGQKSLPENYRPVSLTAIPCKLFEHIIVSKTWEHLNRHKIITCKQHGFRTGMSCETQLIEALNDWTSILNKGQSQVDVIVLDFSKAFDMVPHERLLLKLERYGITGNTQRWIRGFLTTRSHEVVVSGTSSKIHPVTSGVPQGTVLGPLLFLLYINDIETSLSSTIRLFADDSAIYREIRDDNDTTILQNDLSKLQQWADLWQMSFNIKKCKVLKITRRTKHKNCYKYTMSSPSDGSQIVLDETPSEKYLGVMLDNKLSFNEHITLITNKATKLLNLCRRNLHMCSPNIKESAYKAIVRPHLEYASAAWNPFTQHNINRIEGVQRRAARFILGNYTYGPDAHLSEEMENTLKWHSLQHRRAIRDLQLFFKIKNELVNIPFPHTVTLSTRNPNKFITIQALHSEVYKYQFFPRTIRLWNSLPLTVTSAPTLEAFRNKTISLVHARSWHKVNNTWALL